MEAQDSGRTESAAFAANVRALRQERGWSQAQMARRLTEAGAPMKANRVATIEAPGWAPRTISLDQAAAFAEVFGVQVDALVGEPLDARRVAAIGRVRRASQARREAEAELEDAEWQLATLECSGDPG